jgi:hypothetical protein
MWFAFYIEQDISRFDVSMQDAVFVRVMNGASYLCNELRRLPCRHRVTADYFIKLTAFDEFHAEIAGTLALAYFVDGNNARMIEAGGSFCFPTKALQVRFGRPLTKTDDL